LDNLGREAVAAIADLGHHRWLRLKSLNGKPAHHDVTRPFIAFGASNNFVTGREHVEYN
jgi:hypothetical protein